MKHLFPIAFLDATKGLDGCDKILFDELAGQGPIIVLDDLASNPEKLKQLIKFDIKTIAFQTTGQNLDTFSNLKEFMLSFFTPEFCICTSPQTLDILWATLKQMQQEKNIIILDSMLEPVF